LHSNGFDKVEQSNTSECRLLCNDKVLFEDEGGWWQGSVAKEREKKDEGVSGGRRKGD